MKADPGRGAWMGALIGGGTFVVLGVLTCDGRGGLYDPSRGECAQYGALIGGAAGTLIGLLMGSLVKTQRWEEVRPDRPLRQPESVGRGSNRKAP